MKVETQIIPGGYVRLAGQDPDGRPVTIDFDPFEASHVVRYMQAQFEGTGGVHSLVKGSINGGSFHDKVRITYRSDSQKFWLVGAGTGLCVTTIAEVPGSLVREFPAFQLMADINAVIAEADSIQRAEAEAKAKAAKKAGVKLR